MQIRKLIARRHRHRGPGTSIDAEVNAAIAANVGESGSVTKVSSKQTAKAGGKRPEDIPDDRA